MTLRIFSFCTAALAAIAATATLAQSADTADPAVEDRPGLIRDAGDTTLDAFQWTARPIIVFADTPADPRFQQQIDMLKAELDQLIERDVVVLTDTDPSRKSPVRQKLRPRGFQLVLVGKEGTVKLRKPFPYSVREITHSIDKMPLRQQEIRERRGTLTE